MAILAANRSLQICLQFQTRSPRISSLAKKGYTSSGPVAYIPKDFKQTKKTLKLPPFESSKKEEVILSRNGVLEGGMGACKLPNSSFGAETKSEDANSYAVESFDSQLWSESELLPDEVSNSQESRLDEKDELHISKIRQDADKTAIGLLAARAFTEAELGKKLRGKKYPPNIVKSVIADIKRRGLLNDGLYAESFSRSRWLSSTWGPRRIKQALSQKGVSETEVEKAVKLVFEDDDLDGNDQNTQHGMSKLSMDRLFLQASKQWLRSQNSPLENRKSRIVRWLQYRGFNWAVTGFVLKKLEAQYPP